MWLVIRRNKDGGDPLVCADGFEIFRMREARRHPLARWPYDHKTESRANREAASMNKSFGKKFTYTVEWCRTLKDALAMKYRFAQRKRAKK